MRKKVRKKPVRGEEASGCLVRMRGVLPSLHRAEKKVADYILSHAGEIMHLTVSEVAVGAGASEATVVRFCRTLGYRGYQDLKLSLVRESAPAVKSIDAELSTSDDVSTICRKVFLNNIRTLEDTLKILDVGEVERAAECLLKARKVLLIGVGTSSPYVYDAYNKLFRLGIECDWQTDSHLQVMAASLLKRGDVVLAISHSGSTKDPIETVGIAKKAGAVAICITNNSLSPLAQAADIRLYTASGETHYRAEALSSRIAQVSIIDVLHMILALRNTRRTLANMKKIEEAIVIKQY